MKFKKFITESELNEESLLEKSEIISKISEIRNMLKTLNIKDFGEVLINTNNFLKQSSMKTPISTFEKESKKIIHQLELKTKILLDLKNAFKTAFFDDLIKKVYSFIDSVKKHFNAEQKRYNRLARNS